MTASEESLSERLDRSLHDHFAERTAAASKYGNEFSALWKTAAEHMSGGKRLRPRLLLDTYAALMREPSSPYSDEAAIELATNLEILHYAFLLHDDVIDGDFTRRRRPNLIAELAMRHSSLSQRAGVHWARSSAILLGDVLLTGAILGIARTRVPESVQKRLLDLAEHVLFETVAGEHTDIALSAGVIEPELQSILEMNVYKTATYSFALPLRGAAILADSTAETEALLGVVGSDLGLAYQLQDDLFSVFGDPDEHGKDPFSDLREGKQTALIAFARTTDAWSEIAPHIGSSALTAANAERIRGLLRACGAEEHVRSLVDGRLSAATSAVAEGIERGALSPSAGNVITATIERVEGRRG